MAAQGEVEWQAAHSINVSVDLVEAAKIQLAFLSEVERYPCLYWNHEAINKAIHRYNTFWLPLAAEEGGHIVPPLDCGWIWHCHRLSPVQYARDCETRFGKTIDVTLLSGAAHAAAKVETERVWTRLYGDEPYSLNLSAYGNSSPAVVQQPGQTPDHSLGQPQPEANEPQAGYNLADAVARQRSFAYQVSRPYMSDPSFLQASLMRYKGFLHLARIQFSGRAGDVFLVPTYDIDLFWHAHQLSPVAYQKDTIQLIGHIFDHDDTDSDRAPGQKLDVGYADTCRLWGQTFGQEYVRAGVLYRGEAPQLAEAPEPVAEPPVLAPLPDPAALHQSNVTRREVLEAHIAVLGARDVRVSAKTQSTLFVTVRVLRNCKYLKLKTPPVAASTDPEWKHVWSLECETATKGLVFELWKKSGGFLKKLKGNRLQGRLQVPWASVLAAPTLSLDQYFPLLSSQPGLNAKPPALHLSVSVTPPAAGPLLLRTEPLGKGIVTDDNGVTIIFGHPKSGVPQAGRWISRTVVDHAGKKVYAVRIRAAKGSSSHVPRQKLIPVEYHERVICVHQGSWSAPTQTLDTHWQKFIRVPNGYVAAAEHQGITASPPSTHWRQWALPDGQGLLDITIVDTRLEDPIVPNLRLTGRVGSSVILVPGRQMQYSAHPSKPVDEEGFVTMIRYSVTHPQGKASALFNWKSGNMEVEPNEDVVLVVLLSTAIGTSMFDIFTARFASSGKRTGSRSMSDNQWGAVRVNRGVRDPRDNYTYIGAGDPMFSTMLLYWWAFSPTAWYGGGGCGGSGGCGGGCGGGGVAGGGGCGGGGCEGGGTGGCGGGGGCGVGVGCGGGGC